ncbi:hypothetical protein DI392_14485 [Vibrio albus]|uniref:Uncharacterized protein n=1 Tax=Vibrio albus TaxID=2200953 RepID=A0A2U3B743_9VIBR|nr:hypothetical protein [Vibrio albus]PWI32623.1 hypothetical protein DI392_14485 [Vibrio albus]
MPDLYCEVCKRVTPHKSVMRRSQEEELLSLTQKLTLLTIKIFTGKNHYKLEQQHFCRQCNCQTVAAGKKTNAVNREKPIVVKGKPEQVGAL